MEQIEVPQTLHLDDPICDPLTVQLSEKEAIPFKVIVKCERTELTLSSFQRPVTISDQLLFSCMNERNYDSLKKEIGDYKTSLKMEAQNAENFQDNFEATCKIFLGTQYLGQNDQKVKLRAQERQQQQSQTIRHDNIQSEIGRNQTNPSVIITGRNPSNEPLNVQRQSTMVRNKQVLVCGLYENQTTDQIKDFIRAFYNQNVDIVILVNGLKSLNKTLKEELLKKTQKTAKIQREIEQNKFAVNNALLMQYSTSLNSSRLKSQQSLRGSDAMPRVIFLIKYLKSSFFDVQKWIYAGVAKHFDPDYFYVTKCSNMAYSNAIQKQICILNHQKLCGVTCNVLSTCQSSWSPCNIVNAFLLNQTINQLEHQPVNKLFSVSMDHDPLFCFYKWQEAKSLMESYLFKLSKSESDLTQNIIIQGVNCLLPFIAAENGLYFAKNHTIVASTEFKTNLSTMMEEQRKRNNAQWYSSHLFWKTYQYGGSKWKLNIFVRIIQTCILLFRAMLQQLDSYFGIGVITFLICQSSYQFFGSMDFSQNQMVQMIIPALFIFALLVYVIFANVFNGSQILATSKYLEPIVIEGRLVCYLTQCKTTNEISLYLDRSGDSESECKIIHNTNLLQPEDITLAGYFNNKQLILTLSYQNQRYVASKSHSQAILNAFQKQIKDSGFYKGNLHQSQKITNDKKEAFIALKVSNMLFHYANNINEAASSFQRLYYVLAILNVSLLAMFILNIITSYFYKQDSPYKIMICACFLIMILQKFILVFLNPSHFSNFIKGFFSYVFYYLSVTYGMKFYEMANIDRNYENVRLDRFYYDKVQTIGLWITYNVVFLFICFMIEAYYNYCGYVLLAFLFYYGVGSALEILGLILSKCFFTSEKKIQDPQSAADTSVNSNQQYPDDDFRIENEEQYENAFLKKQIEASDQYYQQQQLQTKFIQEQIQNQQEQTKKLFESMKISKQIQQNHQTQQIKPLPAIDEVQQSQFNESSQASGMLQSNIQGLKQAIPNFQVDVKENDEMLESKRDFQSVGKNERFGIFQQKN